MSKKPKKTKPSQQTFEGQHPDEEVLMVFRRHPVVMRKGLIIFLLGILVGFVPITIDPLNLQLLWFVLAGTLAGGVALFYAWIAWYYSVFIVTDQRLIQITQKGLFTQSVVDIGLDRIQSINFQISGFQETVLKFGTILVQTFVGDMVIDQVHKPQEIHQHLVKIVKELGGADLSALTGPNS